MTDIIEKMTAKEMCEHIERADILIGNDGTKPTAIEIFNYSSTGELFMLQVWYEMACRKLGCTALEEIKTELK